MQDPQALPKIPPPLLQFGFSNIVDFVIAYISKRNVILNEHLNLNRNRSCDFF